MADRIVYVSVTKGGGIDGMDHTNKGGTIMAAGFSMADIPKSYQNTGWYTIEKRVIDINEGFSTAFAKLNPVDILMLRETGLSKPTK